MKLRTTLILAALAIAMGAYIYIHERHTLSQGEVEGRGAHLLQRFVRARVTSIEVQRSGVSWKIERIPGADEAVDLHIFRIVAPVQDAADDEAVNALLGSLEWTDARRTLVGVTANDRATYGLTNPRIRATVRVANENIRITFGAEVPGGQGVYASLDDPNTAYVVGKDFFEAFDFDAAHFRSKSFFDGRSAAGAVRVTLRNEHGSFVLDRPDGHKWWVREPVAMFAAGGAVDGVLNSFESAHIERFVDETSGQLSQYGLSPAVVDVRATMEARDGAPPVSMRIRLGNACEGQPAQVYAMIDDAPPVVCVNAESFASLRVSAAQLNESHLFVTPDESIERVDVSAGSHSLRVSRTDDGWKYAADGTPDAAANEAAVARFVADLRALTVVGTANETGVDSVRPASVEQVRALHLETPLAVITITKTEGAGIERVSLGALGSASWIRRGEEPVVFLISDEAARFFQPTAVRVRSLDVVHEDDARATAFVVTQASGEVERVELVENQWRVVQPVAVNGARALVVAFLRRFATLQAERFVSATRTAGLRPVLSLAATFRDATGGTTHTRTLHVSENSAGGFVGSMDSDPAEFEVAEDFVSEAKAHFADRDLLASDVADVEDVVVEHGRARERLIASADSRATPVYQALPLLHASRTVDYSGDVGRVQATVTVTRREGGPLPRVIRIVIGAESGEGDAAVVRVRRDDVPAVFELPVGNVRPLLGVAPEAVAASDAAR